MNDERFLRSRASKNERPSSGFTLLEMLVSIAIVGMVLGMALPAVQVVRGRMRQSHCENQIRQLALAVHQFSTQHRHLPTNGGADLNNPINDVGGNPFQPGTTDLYRFEAFDWGFGSRNYATRDQTGSWAYQILPSIGQTAAWESGVHSVEVPILLCPSRDRGGAMLANDDGYGLYRSGGLAFSKTDYCMNDRIAVERPDWETMASILDGLSQTVLIGEKAIDPSVQTSNSWYWDEPFWLGGSKGTARSGKYIYGDEVGTPFRDNWGSRHIGGAVFARCDGSTVFLTDTMDSDLLEGMLSPASRDVASLDGP